MDVTQSRNEDIKSKIKLYIEKVSQDQVKNLLVQLINYEEDQIKHKFAKEQTEVLSDIYSQSQIYFIHVIRNLIGHFNDTQSQTFRCWLEDVTLDSAALIHSNSRIDYTQEVQNNQCILFDFFINIFKSVQPQKIPILWDLLDYNKIMSNQIQISHNYANSNNEYQSQVEQFVSEIREMNINGLVDTALFTMMACKVQDQFTMPEVLGMVNNSSCFEKVKEQALKSKDTKLGNALLTHVYGVRKGWTQARSLLRSLELSYKDHYDLQIQVQAQFAKGVFKSYIQGKFDLFKLKDLGLIKAEVCALLLSALFKEERSSFHSLVSLYLNDQIKTGDPKTCPFFAVECHDLVTPHAKDYFRSNRIQVDSWPDIHNTDLEFLEQLVHASTVKMPLVYGQFGPVTPGCLSLLTFFPAGVEVHFVEDAHVIQDILAEAESSRVVQIDSEWNPINSDNENPEVQIIQLQTTTSLQILDHAKLKKEQMQCECLGNLFESESIMKVGYDLRNDISHLAGDVPAQWKSTRDLQPHLGHSLSSYVKNKLGVSLCKQHQVSNWGKRPLVQSQIHYAAMDSFVLYLIDK